MSFHDVRFPTNVSYGSVGGPVWSTTVVALRSGAEARNANFTAARYRYNVKYGVKTGDQINSVQGFFHARRGRLHSFRYKDWLDYKSSANGGKGGTVAATDQAVGTLDKTGPAQTFQLVKTYSDAAGSWSRTITKPVSGTVKIAVGGVEKAAADANYPWSVNLTTGVVTITPTGLTAGTVAVTAGFEFDVHVRFDVDQLDFNLDFHRGGSAQDIPLIEVREC